MSEFTADQKVMLKTILAKRQACVQLTDVEDKFAREMFDALVDSKQMMTKVVKFVTGAELRKSKVDAPAARKGGENESQVAGIEDDKPTAKPDTSACGTEKLPDVDNKPKEKPTEDKRLADILQIGELVTKAVGERTLKGTVMGISVDGATAIVKYEDGRQVYEQSSTLKSTKIPEAKEVSVSDKEHAVPVEKGAISHTEAYEQVKDKPGVEDPHALAQHIVENAGGEKVKKDGDIASETSTSEPAISTNSTPFEGLVHSLQCVLDLGRDLKNYRETAGDDEEVLAYYDEVINQVRDMAESILAALAMELGEAKSDAGQE